MSAFDRLAAALADHYLIERELGQGGMATVYLAHDLKHDRPVAIKILRPDLAASLGADRFLREIKLTAKLNHPHILPLLDSGEAEGFLYYVMPFVEGESLRDRLEHEKQLPLEDALQITREVADALGSAHGRGVIHRDIKPENILLQEGHAVVADFGVARAVSAAGGERLTGTGLAIGTPLYMSPEQATGTAEVDGRADIYALGCVLYEMLAGHPPFTGATAHEVIARHTVDPVPSLRAARDGVPEPVERAVLKALSKTPADRYATAAQFTEALRAAGHQEPAGRLKESRVSRRLVTLAAGAVLLVGVLVVWLWTNGQGDAAASGPPRVVVLPFENLGSPDDEYFADGITEEVTSRLARISGLVVISRTSAVLYKNSDKPLRQIGSELDVRYVLEGTIRTDRSAGGVGQVRVTPQLIRVADDAHLWTEPYSAGIVPGEIFQVQADIAERVAQAMNVTLLEPERGAFAERPTESAEAYDYYLRGKAYYNRSFSELDLRNAIEMYQRATAADRSFAIAYAQLALAHTRVYWLFYDRTTARVADAKAAIDRAIELNPELPETHTALGYYHYWGHLAYDRALAEFDLALRSQPNDFDLITGIASVRRRQGAFREALVQFEKAFQLDPRSARGAQAVGGTYLLLGDSARAERYLDQAISLVPSYVPPYELKARLYLRAGSTQQARAILQLPGAPLGDASIIYHTAVVDIFEGKYQAALERVAAVERDAFESQISWVPKSQVRAQLYALLDHPELSRGQYDSARAVAARRVRGRPDEANYHSALGIAYAGLWRKAEAIGEARKATELLPVSKEAYVGLHRLEDLARVYVMVGEYDLALDELERLLSLPGGKSIPFLKLDPVWNPLRDHPRFRALLRD